MKTASILLIITLLTSVFATANSPVVSGAPEEWTGRIDGQGVINEPEYNLTIDFYVSGDFSFRVLSDNTITGNGVVNIRVDWTGDIGIAVCRANESVIISSSVGGIYYPSTNEVSLTFDNSPKSFRMKLVCQSQYSGELTYYVDIPTYIDAPVVMELRAGAEYFAKQYYPAEQVEVPLKFSIIGGGSDDGGVYEEFDFSISVMKTTLTVSPGNSVVTTVTVYLEKGAAQPVTLKVGTTYTELTKTVKVSLSKITGDPNFSSDLTIITSPDAPQGTFTIAVIGEGAGITHNKQLTLVIGGGKPSPYPEPTPTPTEKPDFTVSVLPTSRIEVSEGETASLMVKINWHTKTIERVYLNVESDPPLMPWHKITLQPKEIKEVREGTADLKIQIKPAPAKSFMQGPEEYKLKITAKSVYSGITKSATVTLVVEQEPRIKVIVDPGEILLSYDIDQKKILNKPQSKITIIAKKGNEPLKGAKILIKVCTELSKDTDGHYRHDKRNDGWEGEWNEKCDQGGRPFAVISDKIGETRNGDLLERTTNEKGEIKLTYKPPKNGRYYIAGEDKITATLMDKPKVKGENWIVTKVPGLTMMPGSDESCGNEGDLLYYFERQGNHGCIFYGTDSTNKAVVRIAAAFVMRQEECAENPSSKACEVTDGMGNTIRIKSKGEPIKMKITAMSLPWGGLSDVKGNWEPPHKTHNDGRQVDIGFGNFKGNTRDRPLCNNYPERLVRSICNQYDIDRILLLKDVIMKDANFYGFVSYEGGDMTKTFMEDAPHIHIFFRK